MIRSVARPMNAKWHRHHRLRYRRTLLIMAAVLLLAGTLAAGGYFAGVSWPALADALIRTTYRLAASYLLALALGVALALLVGWSPVADYLFPVFDILQNIPSFALIPLFIYFFGATDEMIILFAVSSIIWPILFAVLTAIRGAHVDLSDAATVYGARGWRRVPYYLAPLSYPAILTGSVVGIAIGWEAVIGAEIIVAAIGATTGFGAFIAEAGASGLNAATIAGTLSILLLVFVVNRLVWAPLLAESSYRYGE
ncbi:MAG: ABC transporter permease subunit [Patescibacteria group bacterium]|nr:ABC transporter permease subunit [Patescibacteria group bacterium]MDE1944466.1 ABC transporter permease subunit [Patescibacteria group bacterium]MDE1945291.1 ABC transporter permease subunit [Patescibacteria group bacterium]MDE2057868.1 ABC transporter permease subunit [Patescibacteria group bacterium]